MILEGASLSYFGGSGLFRWASYIVSPVVTLMLGSYGLAPSAMRNLGLVVLGEFVGFLVCHADRIYAPWSSFAATRAMDNTTSTSL